MKDRLSNMELLRIVAMFLVLLLHCNYSVIGPVSQSDVISDSMGAFTRILTEQLCLCCVNIFVLISGWFGIKFTFKGVCSLLFQVLALVVVVCVALIPFSPNIPYKDLFKVFYIGSYYWFIPSYLILFVFSSVLNAFVENTDRALIKRVLLGFFVLEFALGWLFDWDHFGLGYSGISFMGLYLMARFLNKFKDELFITTKCKSWYLGVYLLCSIIPATITFYAIRYMNYGFNQLSYASPFVIGASVSMLLLFSKFEFESKFVNWIAASAFSMYLIQLHPMIWPIWTSSMNDLYKFIGGGKYIIFSMLVCVAFGVTCVLIDQIRIKMWNIIKIKI